MLGSSAKVVYPRKKHPFTLDRAFKIMRDILIEAKNLSPKSTPAELKEILGKKYVAEIGGVEIIDVVKLGNNRDAINRFFTDLVNTFGSVDPIVPLP